MIKKILILSLFALTIYAQEVHFKGTVKIDSLITTILVSDTTSDALKKSDSTLYATQTDLAAKASIAELSDSLALKLDKDFTGLDEYTPSSTDVVPFYSNELASTQQTTLADLPTSVATSGALSNKVNLVGNQTDGLLSYVDFYQAFVDSIALLRALINIPDSQKVVVDSPLTPTSFAVTSGSGVVTGTITLTWSMSGSYDSIAVWASIGSPESYSVIAYVDSGTVTYAHTGQAVNQTNWYYLQAINGSPAIYSAATAPLSGTVNEVYYDLWYLSNAAIGAGTGTSWATAANYLTFNTNLPQPGDTVYIDGGADSMIYKVPTGQEWEIYTDGAVGSPVVYTRGIDASHNGVPRFRTYVSSTGVDGIINMMGASYLEFSYLEFDTTASGRRQINLYLPVCHDISFLHNTFNYVTGKGIQTATANRLTIMYNSFTSGNNNMTMDAIVGSDGNYLNEGWIIAHNTFRFISTLSGTSHTDFIQAGSSNLGLSPQIKDWQIYNNFFYSDVGASGNSAILLEYMDGTSYIYNNIIDLSNNTTYTDGVFEPGSINIQSQTGSGIVHVYNNTIINGDAAALSISQFADVYFKNNLMSWNTANGAIPYIAQGADITRFIADYNVYEYTGSFINSWSTATWTGYGQDANSYFTGFTVGSIPSSDPSEYELVSGDGIGDGTTLSSYFTTDYEDSVRSIPWDIGAFEGVAGSAPTEGEELIVNGTFSTDASSWSASVGTLTGSVDAIADSNNVASFTATSDGVNARFSQDVVLQYGSTYTVTFDYYLPSANTSCDGIGVYSRSAGGTNTYILVGGDYLRATDTWTRVTTATFTPSVENTSAFYFRGISVEAASMTPGDVFYIDNVSIKEVLP